MIKFVGDLLQVGGFLWVFRFSPSIKLTPHDITEILKVVLNTIALLYPERERYLMHNLNGGGVRIYFQYICIESGEGSLIYFMYWHSDYKNWNWLWIVTSNKVPSYKLLYNSPKGYKRKWDLIHVYWIYDRKYMNFTKRFRMYE